MISMQRILLNKNVLWGCLGMLIYYAIMELYFLYFIGIEYSLFGFKLDFNLEKYAETKILFAIVLIQAIFISKISDFIYSIFIFFLVFFLVPSLITYSFADQDRGPLYSTFALVVAVGVFSVFKFEVPEIKRESLSFGAVMVLLILVLAPILFKFGIYFNLSNFVFEDILKTREQFDANSTAWINYLYNWLVKAVVPVVLVFFLIHKRYGYALISAIVLLYLFVISGNKLVYITTFVMLFFMFCGNGYFEKVKYLLFTLIAALVVIPVVDKFVLNNHILKGVFVMRMLFLPAQLNYNYFDFFEGNYLFFSESNFFRMYSTYPYDRPVGFIISETYFNAPEMNANNGIISDGFMNLGYPGIALNILIVAFTFMFFNSTKPDPRYLGIFFVMIFLFLSAPMLSMFVTSGLWIIILLSMTVMKAVKPTTGNV